MANISRVNGFRPVKHLDGSPYNGQVNKYWVAAGDGTALFVGDIVKLSGTSDTDGNASVIQVAAGNTPVGVVIAFEPNPADLTQNYRPASQNIAYQNAGRWVYVADAPDLIMEVEATKGSGSLLTVGSVGQNFDLVVAAGSTTTGQSGMSLDNNTTNTTSTLVFQLVGFVQRPDNDLTLASPKCLVRFNVHQYGSVGTAGI